MESFSSRRMGGLMIYLIEAILGLSILTLIRMDIIQEIRRKLMKMGQFGRLDDITKEQMFFDFKKWRFKHFYPDLENE